MRRFFNLVTGDAAPGDAENPDSHSFDGLGEGMVDEDADDKKSVEEGQTEREVSEQKMVAVHVIEPGLDSQWNPSLSAMLRLRAIVAVLRGYADETVSERKIVLDALKDLAEAMVWADQHDPNVWDLFLEFAVMPLLVRCLRVTVHRPPVLLDIETVAEENLKGEVQEDNIGTEGAVEEVEYDMEFADRLVISSDSGVMSRRNSERGDMSSAGGERENGPREPSASILRTDATDVVGPETLKPPPARGISSLSFSSSIAEEMPSQRSSLDDVKRPPSVEPNEVAVDCSREIQAQILQTISIVIQSVSRQQSLLCLFSANHINDVLSFEFAFENDEVLAYFMSAVKSIALKLDEGLLQLFFDPVRGSFPLYSAVIRFLDHPEAMVRIAVRNITLTIYALGDSEVLKVAAKDEMHYFKKTIELLAKLCGSVALAFEFLLDDGRELRRTRSRTGLFRRRVKISEVTSKLEEIENIIAYLGDVSTVSQAYLHPLVVNLISSRLFSPFFRPIASLASPEALQSQKRWRISRADSGSNTKPALPLFDAAARCMVLACLLTHCKSSPLGSILVRDLCCPTSEFEGRHVLNGLKAMATDITGTERVAFISLCAIEAFISCQAASKRMLASLKYDFFLDDVEGVVGEDGLYGPNKPFINIGIPDEDDLQRRGSEQLLMTLSEFEAPLTPTTSRPSTPTLTTVASFDRIRTPPNGLHESRMSSFDSSNALNLSPNASNSTLEKSDSDGILSSFRNGQTSLREAISSIVLVVRRREVRTVRVLQAIARIIRAVGKRTRDINSCVDVTKIILDELAGVVSSYMQDKRTTIVSIEQMFDNYRKSLESRGNYDAEETLELILSADRLPSIVSEYPKGAGKRRRVLAEDPTPPVDAEDAYALTIMMKIYDESLESARVLDKFGSLSRQVEEKLTANGVEDSYLEKRYALEDISKAILKHGLVD